MQDIVIYDVGAMLAYSKRRSYKENIITMFDTYIKFLQGNGLTKHNMLPENTLPDKCTIIKESDFTEEGLEFVKKAEQKWFKFVDHGGSPEDTSILEKELSKIRSKK